MLLYLRSIYISTGTVGNIFPIAAHRSNASHDSHDKMTAASGLKWSPSSGSLTLFVSSICCLPAANFYVSLESKFSHCLQVSGTLPSPLPLRVSGGASHKIFFEILDVHGWDNNIFVHRNQSLSWKNVVPDAHRESVDVFVKLIE